MRHLQPRLIAPDLMVWVLAVLLTVVTATRATEIGTRNALLPILAILFVFGVVSLTIAAPHVLVAAIVPIFAFIPLLKVLAVPWIGPLKDAVTLCAAIGVAVLVVQRRNSGEQQRGDRILLAVAAAFLGLYVLNLGGAFAGNGFDSGWAQGVRLTAEPILLLGIGLLVSDARRAFRWGLASLAITAGAVAVVGLWQQYVGEWALVDMGYEFDRHVRTINGRLRSFGTLDDPFAYAALLLSGIVAVAFSVRRTAIAVPALVLLCGGLLFGYVRTSAIILVALVGVWLARKGHPGVAALVFAASATAAVGILVVNNSVSESRVVRADSNTYLTINGRTNVWKNVLVSPSQWLLGRGVGQVGTAAERAQFGTYRTVDEAQEAENDVGPAVDNGYLAAIADVGVLGLALLLVLFARLAQLTARAIRDGFAGGWVAAGLLTVVLLDAVTRASFTGFPTAFLTFLLVGLALNAADEQRAAARGVA